MKQRNVTAQMSLLINEMAVGTYVPGVVAKKIVDHLKENDPKLLTDWLMAHAEGFIRNAINNRDKANRATNRTLARRNEFKQAAKQLEGGDPEALTNFLNEVYETEGGTKVPLKKMSAKDLEYAAFRFGVRAQENTLRKVFLETLSKKLSPNQTVSDLYSEDDLARIWNSIN